MSEDADDWSDYDSGPFCRHWSQPWDCEEQCGNCGHSCNEHPDDECEESGCDCKEWIGK